jgi:hypothetical protein
MEKRNLATSIKLWSLCLALGAASAADAKTIELRDVRAIERYSITDVITLGQSIDRVGFNIADGSQLGPFDTTLDLSIFSFDLLGTDDFSATLQHLSSSGFQTVATSFDGPISFDELLGPSAYGSGIGSGLLDGLYRGSPQVAAVPEADVWVMLLVGFGVVLYQLRRKQRSLEQEPVAA